MKPPKNFYSNLDRRKQGLPEVPEASAADAGKIIKVGSDGSYELGADAGLPVPGQGDTNKVVSWNGTDYTLVTVISQLQSRYLWSSVGNVTISGDTVTSSISTPVASIRSNYNTSTHYFINGSDNNLYILTGVDQDYLYFTSITNKVRILRFGSTLTIGDYIEYPLSNVIYEITASGSSVSLPSGVTFADVYAELMAGVNVKFTSGARVYTVTSFESTRIRAHWISDLDLTSIEVYVINLESDGTGTVASATFSGS